MTSIPLTFNLTEEARQWLNMLPGYSWRWSKPRNRLVFDNDDDAMMFKLMFAV